MSPIIEEKVQVCIIGGGPTGIIYLQELVDAGVTDVRVIEAKKTSGGLFRGCYEDSMLTISNQFITFSKMHNVDPMHMYTEEYADYCDEFVSKFDLSQYMSFETVATKCNYDKGKKIWTIQYKGIGPEGATGSVTSDYLVVASGAHAPVSPSTTGLPSCVKLPGSNGLPAFNNFKGTVIHSSEYQTSNIFQGKHVLVVGSGESGSDIAMAATTGNSKSVAVSVRGAPGHFVPRAYGEAYSAETRKVQSGNGNWWQKNFPIGPGEGPFDHSSNMGRVGAPRSQLLPAFNAARAAAAVAPLMPGDLTPSKQGIFTFGTNLLCGLHSTSQYGTKTGGLPQAVANGAFLVPGIQQVKSKSIVFADGTELEIDLVVLCTGFKTTFPFLEEESPQAIKDFNPRKLWKHMLDSEYGDRLVFGGFVRPAFGSIPQLSEMQARVYAQLVTGKIALPEEKQLAQTIATDAAREETFYISSKDIPALTHFIHYSADMASLIGQGIDYRMLLVKEPKLFLRLLSSPYNVKRFYMNDNDKALSHDARNRFAKRPKAALLDTDLHIWLLCLAITTLVDVPMLSLPGVMPPTRSQRAWAWLTLPVWWILLIPSIYEYAVLWLFALMSPYTWLYLYRNLIHGGDNQAGDFCWAASVLENSYIRNLILHPFSVIAFVVYVILSLPIAIPQAVTTEWAYQGTC
ncbi:monooxygenase [Seminavis robusta]|uniref:Monooxygenase n=1 Tax=Seminavis robusta TaxID=568900 RepID=A0A9N8HFD3_9STRA|nr:monooxygenase [Seminavis robusta]|eukprot:Sro564_g167340.1 monooxygenase (685) ;mRNA; f:23833-25887